MIVIDASVWVSLLLDDDAKHSTTRPWAAQYTASGGTATVPLLFPIEVGVAIRRRTNSLA